MPLVPAAELAERDTAHRPNESKAHRKGRTALPAGAAGRRRHVEQGQRGADWYPSLIHPTL